MVEAKLSLHARKLSEKAVIIDVEGDLTGAAESALMDIYAEVSADNPRAIILNFSKLEYMNSSGIGLLIMLLIRIQRHDQYLLVYGLKEHYRQIFNLTRLDEAVSICQSEEHALSAAEAF